MGRDDTGRSAKDSSSGVAQHPLKHEITSPHFKGLTWLFNDEPISFIHQICSMAPFFLMHI